MAASNDSERRLLWKPRVAATATDRFRAFVNSRHRANLKDYADLHAYSVGEKTADDFWVDLFLFLEIKSDRRPTVSISAKDRRLMFPPPSFFPEVRLNIVENMLSGRDPNAVAIHTCGEGITNLKDITWGTLQSEVQRVADAMISSGVRTDDRVAGILSNRLETVVACLATISIGALWSTTSPDMGVDGILDRLLQIRPKLLFAEKAVFYNGKLRDLMPKNRECAKIMSKMQDFQNIILLSHDGAMREDPEIKLISWDLFLERGVGRELHFKQLPFHHPGLIVYSSGTVQYCL
ncbi:MAG: hypothetical protein M1819_000933 [Sarea resinae]|nr:MAG: hypothetical protein M1819_000933 [Sarea resinae]